MKGIQMSNSDYSRDHRLAKCIVMVIVISLVIVNRRFDLVALDILSVVVWFLGVNPTAWLIETVRGHEHKHDIL